MKEVKVWDFLSWTCDRAACALAQLWLMCMSQPAMRRRPVTLVLVAPAVAHSAVVCCGRSSTLRCAAHPCGAAAQRGAEASAAGAGVSAAPAGVPRGRRAKKNVVKVAIYTCKLLNAVKLSFQITIARDEIVATEHSAHVFTLGSMPSTYAKFQSKIPTFRGRLWWGTAKDDFLAPICKFQLNCKILKRKLWAHD